MSKVLYITIFLFNYYCFPLHADTIFNEVLPASELNINLNQDIERSDFVAICGRSLEKDLQVKISDTMGVPACNREIQFRILSMPASASGTLLNPENVLTDSSGIAATSFTPGSKPGEYLISCSIKDGQPGDELIIKIDARRRNWIYMMIIGLFGGLGLFLFGMHTMSEGMQKSAGQRMRSILSSVTRNRIVGAGIGTFVTMIIQSSSATSVMLVSFVNARLITFRQTLPVLLGAAIGTTITAQLIAFKITEYALLLVAVGFFIQAFTKREHLKSIGFTIFGFGILFFGMDIMSGAMAPLRGWPPFINLLVTLENPVAGILAGTLLTALIQSSSAFIGILIVLASQGLITMDAAIPLILGTNLGTPITALLASLRASRESKKVAVSFFLMKLLAVFMFAGWMNKFGTIIEQLAPEASMQRMIANAHTIINVVLMAILLPFTGLIARLIDRIMGYEKEVKAVAFKLSFLDNSMLGTPSLALNLAKQEIIRMGNIIQSMFENVLEPFINKDPTHLNNIYRSEKEVNFLRDSIKEYLLMISKEAVNSERINESFQMLYSLNEFEKISDIISGGLANRAEKWIAFNYEFSEKGKEELKQYHEKIYKQINLSIEVFEETNLQKAAQMKAKHKKYRNLSVELEKQHYDRLMDGLKESIESSKTHLEILALMSSIDSHATNVARIALDWSADAR